MRRRKLPSTAQGGHPPFHLKTLSGPRRSARVEILRRFVNNLQRLGVLRNNRIAGGGRKEAILIDQVDANRSGHFTLLAVCFEVSLGALAVALGWLTGPWPWDSLFRPQRTSHLAAVLTGAAVALPLLAGIVLVDRRPGSWPWLADLQRVVRHHVVPLFSRSRVGELLLISLAAGAGEELLFRGYCQAALTDWWGPNGGTWLAVLASSILFGVCHWLCSAYAVLATVMGLVLGTLFVVTDNLLAPVVTHALYDFLALLYLVRRGGDSQAADAPRA